MPVDIVLVGPQGSGKGTQAKRISADYAVPHVATGDMLREAMAAGTPLGERVRPIYEAGQLVPDELMIELIRERLAQPDTETGFILDGFPRTIGQAEALDEMLRQIGREPSIVFEFQIDNALCIERMLGRAREEGRTDDTPEAIAERLRLYHEHTAPLVGHYRALGILVGIHAERPIGEVYAEIQDALEQVAARA